MLNFKELGQKAGTLDSDIVAGKRPIHVHEVADQVLTINQVGRSQGINKETGERVGFNVVTFDEYPDCYLKSTGVKLDSNIAVWAAAAGDAPIDEGGSYDMLNAEIRAAGGIKCKFLETETAAGRRFTNFAVL